MEEVILICDSERVSIKDFKYLYNFNDNQFNALIKNRSDKGYFNYKGFRFLLHGKKNTKKVLATDRKRYETDYHVSHKIYYMDGKVGNIEDIASCTGLTIHSAKKWMIGTRSIVLNGVNIKVEIFIVKRYEIESKDGHKFHPVKTIEEVVAATGLIKRFAYKAISEKGYVHGYKIERIVEEI